MPIPLILAFCAFALSLALTPLSRQVAIRQSWLDWPDGDRKGHSSPIPRIGGVPVLLGYAGSLCVLLAIGAGHGYLGEYQLSFVRRLLPAAITVFAVGFVDDLVGLRPVNKLLGQVLAAGIACAGGVQIHSLAGAALPGEVGVPLTVLWLVTCMNAFNLIDGMDGLASSLGILAALTVLSAGLLHENSILILIAAPLAGALLGFLRFNFSPASIFLGDCGSLWIGFMLGCGGVIWSQTSAAADVTAPLMALSVPLLDTVLSVARRLLRGISVFLADHDHIHHRLLKRGWNPRRALGLICAAALLADCCALLESTVPQAQGAFIVVFLAIAAIGIRYLGYREFSFPRRSRKRPHPRRHPQPVHKSYST